MCHGQEGVPAHRAIEEAPSHSSGGGTSVLHDMYLVGWEMRLQVTKAQRWDGCGGSRGEVWREELRDRKAEKLLKQDGLLVLLAHTYRQSHRGLLAFSTCRSGSGEQSVSPNFPLKVGMGRDPPHTSQTNFLPLGS